MPKCQTRAQGTSFRAMSATTRRQRGCLVSGGRAKGRPHDVVQLQSTRYRVLVLSASALTDGFWTAEPFQPYAYPSCSDVNGCLHFQSHHHRRRGLGKATQEMKGRLCRLRIISDSPRCHQMQISRMRRGRALSHWWVSRPVPSTSHLRTRSTSGRGLPGMMRLSVIPDHHHFYGFRDCARHWQSSLAFALR